MSSKYKQVSWQVNDGSYRSDSERFPDAIQKRIENSYRKQGWLLPGEQWHEDDRRPYGPGCGCGKGWIPLIEKLDAKLAAIDPDYEIHQIKEKFGALRYYVKFSFKSGREWNPDTYEEIIVDPEAYAKFQQCYKMIDEATHESAHTCEVCGNEGKIQSAEGGGWLQCRCPDHQERM